jgi:hypothetical protein
MLIMDMVIPSREIDLKSVLDFPLVVFASSLVGMWLSSQIGTFFGKRLWPLEEDARNDFEVVENAALTLLALLVGFGFSMAVSRYDQRKNYEAAEANAIGTEYVRAGLLPAADAAKVRELLRNYLDQRVLFYSIHDDVQLGQVNNDTTKLQDGLWSSVQRVAAAQPTPVIALAVEGMNDVLNSQGYTQAAWWNRIPIAAWSLMAAIALSCGFLIGYGARRRKLFLFLVLPLVTSIAFFLIADIDSPRRGVILVLPRNLTSLAQSLRE